MENLPFSMPAVLAAALVNFAIGGLWYSPLAFSRAWMREAGLDEERLHQAPMGRVFALAFAAALVMALNLAAFIGRGQSLRFAVLAGLAAGLGWVAMALGVVYLFERRSFRLWLINAGYLVLAFTAMGAVLGLLS
ncbi:MAG: DUF1761 domain-containing protein [Rubrivivax sp.]